MLINFFLTLRKYKVPATIRELPSSSEVEVSAMIGRPFLLRPAPRMKSCKAPMPP